MTRQEGYPIQEPSLIRQYPDGAIDDIYLQAGHTFNVDSLLQAMADDPVLADQCVVVQTEDKRRYVFNETYLTDDTLPTAADKRVVSLRTTVTAGIGDIKVGESWASPLGQTGVVKAVILPHLGNNGGAKMHGGESSVTLGRRIIEDAEKLMAARKAQAGANIGGSILRNQ